MKMTSKDNAIAARCGNATNSTMEENETSISLSATTENRQSYRTGTMNPGHPLSSDIPSRGPEDYNDMIPSLARQASGNGFTTPISNMSPFCSMESPSGQSCNDLLPFGGGELFSFDLNSLPAPMPDLFSSSRGIFSFRGNSISASVTEMLPSSGGGLSFAGNSFSASMPELLPSSGGQFSFPGDKTTLKDDDQVTHGTTSKPKNTKKSNLLAAYHKDLATKTQQQLGENPSVFDTRPSSFLKARIMKNHRNPSDMAPVGKNTTSEEPSRLHTISASQSDQNNDEQDDEVSSPKKRQRRIIPGDKDYITDFVPTDQDVLGGRGGASNNHPGNQRYWWKVLELRSKYAATGKNNDEKNRLAMRVVDYVESNNGRFLDRDVTSKRLFVLPRDVAISKVKQALSWVSETQKDGVDLLSSM